MGSPRVSPSFAVAALLLGTILLAGATARRVAEPLAFGLNSIAPALSGWSAVRDHELPDATIRALDATAYLSRTYKRGDDPLDLFIAFYAQQRAGESMHSPKHCLPGAGWEIWRRGSVSVPGKGKLITVNNYGIQNAGKRMVMLYWYQSKERIIASEYLGKLFLARDSLLTGHTAGSIVRIMLADTPDAVNDGVQFAATLIPEVQRCLGSNSLVNGK